MLLLLIPTQFEYRAIEGRLQALVERQAGQLRVELAGFGPIAAAARTSQLISSCQPDRVCLIGIAGALNDSLAPGVAVLFGAVSCYGVGVGCGVAHRTAGQMGWPHWTTNGVGPPGGEEEVIGDTLQLVIPNGHRSQQLLTACAASASPEEVADRLACYPDAVAEDMEGFGVATACWLQRTPLSIVRGISNLAGDRNHQAWRIAESLHAALDQVETVLLK